MTTFKLTNRQIRRFLLLRHGLMGKHIFSGKVGIMNFLRRTGCLQYDPVDICGRNADIALQSRINGYDKTMLNELLYADRELIDYFDKNLSIFPVEDFPVFVRDKLGGGYAEAYDRRGGEAVKQVMPIARRLIKERGFISAKEIEIGDPIVWHWGALTSLPRAALESMYFRGELIIHHKMGTNKAYAFTKDYVPAEILNAPMPYNTEEERIAWLVKRRIGATGMMWNRASDAWLGINLKTAQRTAAFDRLLETGEIFEVCVEGIKEPFFIRMDEREFLEETLKHKAFMPRMEFIAPLDSLLWDRKLINTLFGFDYKWEIYTVKEKRKFGAYTLPILYGEDFIGRVDMARREGKLVINGLWTESGKPFDSKVKAVFDKRLERFARFNVMGVSHSFPQIGAAITP